MGVTLFDAELFAGGEKLIFFIPASEYEDVAQPACFKIGTHVGVSLLLHAGQFLEFVTNETITLLSARLEVLPFDR
jgi:hypothetical protein